ncbi:MAG: putative glycosyltransferase [Actinomycetia bacterium]|nr:putative glycosyltransferase [Actinomycetes bacterium]
MFACDLGAALSARGRVVQTVAVSRGFSPGGLPVEPLGTGALNAARRLRALRKPGEILVAHGSTAVPTCALAAIGKRGFVYRNIGDPGYWAASPARRLRLAAYLHSAQRVVVLWPGAAEVLVRLHHVAASRIRPIPNGVPAERFPAVHPSERSAARSALGLPAAVPIVAYVGALSPEKDPAAAVRAVARHPELVLAVSGNGPQRAAVEQLAANVAPGRVHFLGVTDTPQTVLAAADALVIPSRTEGMPAVAIEAAFTGIPVVATDVGALREVVVDGETGRIVARDSDGALDEALRDVLADGVRMGERGRAHCLARFEIGIVGAAWDELLDEVR